MSCLIEIHYLPSIAYFSAIAPFDEIVIEKNEFFVKQTYRNRCHINTSNGLSRLVVPLTSKHGKVLITDVRIDYSQKWLNNHWRAIRSAYGKAPYFEFYEQKLHDELFRRHTFLYDLNLELMTICLKWLKMSKKISETMAYSETLEREVIDLRNSIQAKNKDGVEEAPVTKPYLQVFGSKFVPNLSLIDLVFCEGPNAAALIAAGEQ